MRDPRDLLDLSSVPRPRERGDGNGATSSVGRWRSVWFRCCHVYGRIWKNRAETVYAGRCPRCGSRVTARIGPGGTNRRLFEAS